MTITYGPRINVHPDRIGADRSDADHPIAHYLVLHTSEQSGAEDPNDAEDLARYLETPGDRPTSSGGRYGSSYHGVTDTDRVLPAVADHVVAYAAGGGNRYGLHLCLPVKAGQTRTEWLDATSRPYIEQAARWIVDKAARYGIPIRRLSIEQLRAGSWGYCDHNTVSKAFGKSTHTDCGTAFPWDVLAANITALLTTPPTPAPGDHDMQLITDPTDRHFYDTRDTPGARFKAGETRPIPLGVTGRAATINLTVTAPSAAGFLAAWGSGARPGSSKLNHAAGETVANEILVPLDGDGTIRVFSLVDADVVIDRVAVWS